MFALRKTRPSSRLKHSPRQTGGGWWYVLSRPDKEGLDSDSERSKTDDGTQEAQEHKRRRSGRVKAFWVKLCVESGGDESF